MPCSSNPLDARYAVAATQRYILFDQQARGTKKYHIVSRTPCTNQAQPMSNRNFPAAGDLLQESTIVDPITVCGGTVEGDIAQKSVQMMQQ